MNVHNSNKSYSENDSLPVLLSLGANIGDRKVGIEKAVKLSQNSGILTNIAVSNFYETEPVGFLEQSYFLNIALKAHTTLKIEKLLFFLKSIEYLCGRKPRSRWHEREIDIDILLYGNEIIATNVIQIPHPRMQERKFVLVPAAEIASEWKIPGQEFTIADLLVQCKDKSAVNIWEEVISI